MSSAPYLAIVTTVEHMGSHTVGLRTTFFTHSTRSTFSTRPLAILLLSSYSIHFFLIVELPEYGSSRHGRQANLLVLTLPEHSTLGLACLALYALYTSTLKHCVLFLHTCNLGSASQMLLGA